MGIFDVYELKQHVRSIGEYVLYIDGHQAELPSCLHYISEHLKKMSDVLDKMEKNT